MLTTIAVVGIAVLVGIALIIGRIDAMARHWAWRRIAAARYEVWLDQQDRRNSAEQPRCADCPTNRLGGQRLGR